MKGGTITELLRPLYLLLWILTPVEVALPDPAPNWPVLKAFAHAAELWRYGGRWQPDWGQEARWVRTNYHRCKHMPSLSLLPASLTADLAYQYLRANLAYRDYLHKLLEGCGDEPRADFVREALSETEALRGVWDKVYTVADPGQEPCFRRFWLGELIQQLGSENVAAGLIPPPVPLWRFQRVD